MSVCWNRNEHMVFVPVAHEQTLAYDVLKMAQAGQLGTVCLAGAEGKCGCKV